MKWTVFLLIKTTPQWLQLPAGERGDVAEKIMADAIGSRAVALRYFDAEGFSGTCTDIAVFEFEDFSDYCAVIERLRSSPLFAIPYFEIINIIAAVKNGYRIFEEAVVQA